jgi:hypothetical protein
MPRCGRIRTFIREYNESSTTDKISFIPPFIILALEIILIIHAYIEEAMFVFSLTAVLLVISLIEIFLVGLEMHQHYQTSNFDRILTIRLDDFVIERKENNVKKIVEDFIKEYPDYKTHRNEIYHTTCQILETHRVEEIEKEISIKLEEFIDKNKYENVDEIVESFVNKFTKYKPYRIEVYERTCQILASENNKK